MKKILLVEDDSDILAYLEDTLNSFGYGTLAVPDPGAALVHLRGGVRVDLVVSDFCMPGMDGHQFFTALRRYLPSVPVIFLTGNDSIEAYLKSLSLGVFDFACKPIRSKELHRIVEAALNRPEAQYLQA